MALNLSIFGKVESNTSSMNISKPNGPGYTRVENCPICSEQWSFRFIGKNGVWECSACGIAGDWNDLVKQLMKYPEIWEQRIAAAGTPEPPQGLVVLSQYFQPLNQDKRISTGFDGLDGLTDGFSMGSLTVITGKRGSGKSTFASQLALNAIQTGAGVCFYSGELNTLMFSEWMFAQAAGPNHVVQLQGENKRIRYKASANAEKRIRAWMGEKMILYDNEIIKSDEQNSILDRFKEARQRFGCSLFFIDNLMSAKFAATQERDFYRQQSNFVRDLVVFAHEYHSHVVLMAHPRKMTAGDPNDDIAGTADITNLATNVLRVSRLDDKEREKYNLTCDSIIALTKNREYGDLAQLPFMYDPASRRFTHETGNQIQHYGWEY